MKNPFELGPLITAAVIGAAVLYLVTPKTENISEYTTFATGAGVGLAVQIGVRLLGVS